jgi:hypothetical protein
MNILNINFSKIDPSFMWNVPATLGQSAWNSLGGLKFQLPRIETSFFSRENTGNKPLTEMQNNITVKHFHFKKSLTLGKQASYAR